MVRLLFLVLALAVGAQAQRPYSLVVQELKDLVDQNKTFHDLLLTAIDDAHHGPHSTQPWSLTDIYNFWEQYLYWFQPSNNPWQLANGIIETFANTKSGWSLLSTEPGRSWTTRLLDARGAYLWSPASIPLVSNWTHWNKINMSEYIIPKGGYTSFNEFFTRHIKMELRPIAAPRDNKVVDSPADCMMSEVFKGITVNHADPAKRTTLQIKGKTTDVITLLGSRSVGDQFEGGTVCTVILRGFNYHRWNAPVSGKIVQQYEIGGEYWLSNKGWTSYWDFMHRGVIVYETESIGLVAMIPIGMASVGGVNLERRVGDTVRKGDEVGYFAMGGSSIALVFQKGYSVDFVLNSNQTVGVRGKFATVKKL